MDDLAALLGIIEGFDMVLGLGEDGTELKFELAFLLKLLHA
jgi:hypothetical protein